MPSPVVGQAQGEGPASAGAQGFQLVDELIDLFHKHLAAAVRAFGDQPGRLFGQHGLARFSGPTPHIAIGHKREPPQITVLSGVVQVGQQIVEIPLSVHVHDELHVAVQHETDF
jgi:hypothetical protein